MRCPNGEEAEEDEDNEETQIFWCVEEYLLLVVSYAKLSIILMPILLVGIL